jgi:hypothetical protein
MSNKLLFSSPHSLRAAFWRPFFYVDVRKKLLAKGKGWTAMSVCNGNKDGRPVVAINPAVSQKKSISEVQVVPAAR